MFWVVYCVFWLILLFLFLLLLFTFVPSFNGSFIRIFMENFSYWFGRNIAQVVWKDIAHWSFSKMEQNVVRHLKKYGSWVKWATGYRLMKWNRVNNLWRMGWHFQEHQANPPPTTNLWPCSSVFTMWFLGAHQVIRQVW